MGCLQEGARIEVVTAPAGSLSAAWTNLLWPPPLAWNLEEERVQAIAARIGRPQEVAARYVEIALRQLRLVAPGPVAAPRGGVERHRAPRRRRHRGAGERVHAIKTDFRVLLAAFG